jgi:hypothetical protein
MTTLSCGYAASSALNQKDDPQVAFFCGTRRSRLCAGVEANDNVREDVTNRGAKHCKNNDDDDCDEDEDQSILNETLTFFILWAVDHDNASIIW